MRSISCFFKKALTISGPKTNDTPLSFSPQACASLSGSDHSKSHNNPIEIVYDHDINNQYQNQEHL